MSGSLALGSVHSLVWGVRIETVGRGPMGQGRFIRDFEEAISSLVKLSRVGQARGWA